MITFASMAREVPEVKQALDEYQRAKKHSEMHPKDYRAEDVARDAHDRLGSIAIVALDSPQFRQIVQAYNPSWWLDGIGIEGVKMEEKARAEMKAAEAVYKEALKKYNEVKELVAEGDEASTAVYDVVELLTTTTMSRMMTEAAL